MLVPIPSFVKRMPLALQAMVLTLMIGATVWLLFGLVQGRELRETFLSELSIELNEHAMEDRRVFDHHIQGIHDAAKLIVGQKQFWDYINGAAWNKIRAEAAEILHHHELPPWMPRASIMRSFFHARHALLLDAGGMVREVYHLVPHEGAGQDLPSSLIQPNELLQLLSHNQAYMTALEGKPVVIAIREVRHEGELLATLMLSATIDDEFLFEARSRFDSGNIMVLLDPRTNLVVASSDRELAPSGTPVKDLQQNFLMMGKDRQVMPTGSFFDYGASDLELRFVSLVPTIKAEQMAGVLSRKNSQQRMLLVGVLVMVFFMMILGMVRRIRALTLEVINFTKGELGGAPLESVRGDELMAMDREFKNLSAEVLRSQARIQAHADEKVELIRRAAEAEQRQRELESLRSVTEALGVGVIFDGEEGPVPFNQLMEDFSQCCGGLDSFLLPADQASAELILQDGAGQRRVFVVDRHAGLGSQGALVSDVTITRQIERSRRQLLGILDETTDFISSADIEGNILYINRGGRKLLGLSEDEDVRTLQIRDLHPSSVFDIIKGEGLDSARRHGVWIGETALRARDGREIAISQVILAHKDSQGALEYYSTIARDISEQKKMELELQQANEGLRQEIVQRELAEKDLKAALAAADEANRAKSEFLANMSHEIRTPMQAIIGMADMLDETHLTEQQQHLVSTLEQAGNSLLEIVNNILDLSKIEAGKIELEFTAFEIASVIDAVMRICSFKARDKGIAISSHIAEDIPPALMGDRIYLQQVLINLIDNAIKFTDEGSIAVRVKMEQASECRHEQEHDYGQPVCCLQFSVSDTGIGIPKELQQKIFDAFAQADASTTRMFGGTGLGTTISKRIVEKMGGQIWVDSEPGKGSTFFFTAKFALPSAVSLQDLVSIPEESSAGEVPLRILVAEDSEDIRLLILSYMKRLPHSVDLAVNGAEAVEKYRAGDYDLILMDMEMPVMDGYTAVRTIREMEADVPDSEKVPIVALTAHALREHEQRSMDAGCSGHVTKPIKKAQLLALVRRYAQR